MKTVLNFALFLAVLFVSNIDLKAQVPVLPSNTDENIRRLKEITGIIEQVNALPIEFKPNSAEILPRSSSNLQKQAVLLKQLPQGTIVEIGAHSNGYYDIFLQDALALQPTDQRAQSVRRELIRRGVNAASLTAKGYGVNKPIDVSKPNAESTKNERIEFLVEKMPGSKRLAQEPPSGNDSKSGEFTFPEPTERLERNKEKGGANLIVAGRGWEKIVIGATRSEIESALGKPEKFYEGNYLLPDSSAQYFSRGIIVVYDAGSERVKSVDFVGNPAFLDAASFEGVFRAASARPDKNISWGANSAQIIRAYGAPKHKLVERRNGAEATTLTYDQITFTLKSDKLYYITVSADNDRYLAAQKKSVEEKSSSQIIESKPLVYNAGQIIIAGKGSGKIVLGATRAQIEAVLGAPDEFEDEDADILGVYEAHYFSKGINIEYNSTTKAATNVSFYGDTSKIGVFKKYKLFPGATDKGIRWGASPAEVIKAYGEPAKVSTRYNPQIDKDYEYINYPNVSFGFQENRLVFISNDPVWGK
jgi:outer membrane protein OmpA-like peptidoglycan-associated protein